MKQISRIFSSKAAFPKTADQKALERQRSDMDSFMLSFSTHEVIMETIRKTLFEIYKARNMSGILLRGLRVEDFGAIKDNWTGTFEERISLLVPLLSSVPLLDLEVDGYAIDSKMRWKRSSTGLPETVCAFE